ncbi:MAG: extracellular solute-binding protein [Acidimicrobiia bacterium]|nr:extracellular solute-binding protein [Acidimicrobiia bacterium]MDH5422510.1 extracellular solute-binding protein [Acidimicrobiia bacterium]MDH5505203.1 extracellular solute-binding protein [Acidimicrobiia bacterium]
MTIGRKYGGPPRPRTKPKAMASVIALFMVLGACSGSESTADTTGAPAGGGDDPVEVTIWFNGESIPSDEFAALEAEYGIIVNYDIRGDDILTDMLRMRDAGQALPDLVEIDSHLTPAFLEADLLAPMTEQIATWESEDPELYATVPAGVWEDGTYDGEIYHMPNKSLVNAIFYNIAMVEEAGVEIPFDSWWDVVDAARAVQAVRPDLPAYFGNGGASHDRMFLWLYNFGVPFEGNVPQLTSDQGVDFIDFLQTMFVEGITDPEFQIGQQDEAKGAFVSQQLPFISEGLNGGPGFVQDDFVYGEDWATTPLPVHVEDGGTNMGAPRGISLTAGSEHPYEASLVLRYLSDPEIAAERYFVLESGVVQSLPVLDGERMKEEQPFFTPELLEDFKTMESQIPPGTNTNAVGSILIDLIEEVTVVGTEDSPADIATRYQEMLDDL